MIVRNQIRVIFTIFLKFASRLVPDGWVELKISGCRYYFWTFQLELDTLSTKNIEIGSVGTKLQLFEVGWFLENFWTFCAFCMLLELFEAFGHCWPILVDFAHFENPLSLTLGFCFDGWVSVARREFFSQGLFFGPMSSFPVIYSIKFGVNAPPPARYRPQQCLHHILKNVLRCGRPSGKSDLRSRQPQ